MIRWGLSLPPHFSHPNHLILAYRHPNLLLQVKSLLCVLNFSYPNLLPQAQSRLYTLHFSRGPKFLLCGEGADESMAGYRFFDEYYV